MAAIVESPMQKVPGPAPAEGPAKAAEPSKKQTFKYELIRPGMFESTKHYYTRVLNAQIHPTVKFFMGLSPERIVARYAHLHPHVNRETLMEALLYSPHHLRWAGCDLMHTTTDAGHRSMVVIETNSCPSGMKSTPLFDEMEEEGGYATLLRRSFLGYVDTMQDLPEGDLAVVYDKNYMEASGYAACLADLTGKPVHLVPFMYNDPDPPVRFVGGDQAALPVMEIRTPAGQWIPIRAAMRYVTQRPWDRIPAVTRTFILNPVLACLAGGRNKMVAAKAYDAYNVDLLASGLHIRTPHTIRDVTWDDIPKWVERFGGYAVVKIPYSNAGQGVYTITNQEELQVFQEKEKGGRYDKFIVQSLISNFKWCTDQGGTVGRLYHVGTIPNRKAETYVSDLRLMLSGSTKGFRVVGMYARRAREPLSDHLGPGASSWSQLGTNLSVVQGNGLFDTESDRLLLMDRKDFNMLGMGLDDLIDAYVQTVLAVVAIDRMADRLTIGGRFSRLLFRSVNDDEALLEEIKDVGFEKTPAALMDWMGLASPTVKHANAGHDQQ